MKNTPTAIAFINRALDDLEAAQKLLNQACQHLSPIRGAGPQYRKVSALSDQVRDTWDAIFHLVEFDGGLSHDQESPNEVERLIGKRP